MNEIQDNQIIQENNYDNYNKINETNIIDDFISNEIDNIYFLKLDLQDRFYYFLNNMNSGHLLCFITDLKFRESYTQKSAKIKQQFILDFKQEYNKELSVTLHVINNYLSKFKNFQIKESDWLEFCYKYTD